jgi:serine/threonine protein kinase
MICPQCKTEIDENSKSCTECGYDFTEITSQPQKKTTKDPLDDLNTIIKAPETYNTRSEADAKIDTNMGLKVGVLFAGRYEILSEGKAGGMGVVYKCRDCKLEETVALKIIHPDLLGSDELRRRFLQEVSISRKLSQKNIVRVHDLGEVEGIPFFTMEWIEGQSLREILTARKRQNRPFTLKEAQEIIAQLSDALSHAHEYTVHRDIKPENILIIEKREGLQVKLTDFGLAKALARPRLTPTDLEMGTPYYMAPEQMADSSYVDKRADIYAVGVVLFEMLTLDNTSRVELPSKLNPSLPPEIDEIAKKALAKNPEDRYGEIKELYQALHDLMEGKKPENHVLGGEEGLGEVRQLVFSKKAVLIICLFLAVGIVLLFTLKRKTSGPTGPLVISSKPESKMVELLPTHQEPPKPETIEKSESKRVTQKELSGSKTKPKPQVPPTVSPTKITQDDEKRSAIVEANGFALVSKEKTIKELQQEAFTDARRQAVESARTYIQQLTNVRGIKITFNVAQIHGQVELKILEQKDFGIEEGKHYHVWIKAEVQYKLGKPTEALSIALFEPEAPLTVKVWTNKKTYYYGEEMKIYLQGNKPFYARIIYVDISGKIVQLLPNAYRTQNSFENGKTYMIPDQGERFKLEIEPPFGLEKVMVLASTSPLGDVSMEKLNNGTYSYRGSIETLGTRSRGIKITPTEPDKQYGGSAEFYEALWEVQTNR